MREGPTIMPYQNRYSPERLVFIHLVNLINGICIKMKTKKIGLTILKITANKNSCRHALKRKVYIWACNLLVFHLTMH